MSDMSGKDLQYMKKFLLEKTKKKIEIFGKVNPRMLSPKIRENVYLFVKERRKVNSQEILQWLLTMTTKVLCESRYVI